MIEAAVVFNDDTITCNGKEIYQYQNSYDEWVTEIDGYAISGVDTLEQAVKFCLGEKDEQ